MTHKCSSCGLRGRYDKNPKSFLGRFWRFHIRFCPGWKGYYANLPPEVRKKVAEQYNLKE